MQSRMFDSGNNEQEQGVRGVDTHAHVDMLQGGSIASVVERAKQVGISRIGQVFLNTSAYKEYRELFDDFPGVFFHLLGFHPHEASSFTPDSPVEMLNIIRADEGIRACGEIGLDFYRNRSPESEQMDCFQSQLELARENDWPVVIHSRDADDTTMNMLEDMGFRDRPLLWHCFGRELEFGELLVSRGWKISIPGTVTFKKAKDLQHAVQNLPLEHMVLETDCPFLTPEPYRGKKNEPALVYYTAQKVAELKNLSVQEVLQKTGENAEVFFGI